MLFQLKAGCLQILKDFQFITSFHGEIFIPEGFGISEISHYSKVRPTNEDIYVILAMHFIRCIRAVSTSVTPPVRRYTCTIIALPMSWSALTHLTLWFVKSVTTLHRTIANLNTKVQTYKKIRYHIKESPTVLIRALCKRQIRHDYGIQVIPASKKNLLKRYPMKHTYTPTTTI